MQKEENKKNKGPASRRQANVSRGGFVILFAVVLSSIILAITIGVMNISLKEMNFSTQAKNTNEAFFAADAGVECAFFNDKSTSNSFVETEGSGFVICLGRDNIPVVTNGSIFKFTLSGLGNDGRGCAKVTVDKTLSPKVTIVSKGYNVGDESCFSSSPNRIERELKVTFNNNLPVVPYSDGSSWTARVAALPNYWTSVTYGAGKFVAVSANGSVMTSPDSIVWTEQTAAIPGYYWTSVTYGAGKFVAVSANGSVMTSPDGITWTARDTGSTHRWTSVTYGNGKFVAVAFVNLINQIMTSPDGITWTYADAFSASSRWTSVTFGDGKFVAVSSTGNSGVSQVMYSTDGVTWKYDTNIIAAGGAATYVSVSHGNGVFVAVNSNNEWYPSQIITSVDGRTWTYRNAARSGNWSAVTFGNGVFVAVSLDGLVMTSLDGVSWVSQTAAESNQWSSVTYGDGKFVAVAKSIVDGTHYVMSSP